MTSANYGYDMLAGAKVKTDLPKNEADKNALELARSLKIFDF